MSSTPPKFVPTLTDIVQPVQMQPVQMQQMAEPHNIPEDPARMGEQIIHRVMQRIDLVLEQRMTTAIAQLVSAQTNALVPRLREEIEAVVQAAVNEAIASELPLKSV